MTLAPSLPQIESAVESVHPLLISLSHAIHANPELGFDEVGAVSRIADVLAAHGIESSRAVFGLDTSLVARFDGAAGPGPTIAILAEYDALPVLGHACGHNVIAATAVGAFLALRKVADELAGTIVLLGTPAEENGNGKEHMARAGAFDDVDAALMIHPHAGPDVAAMPVLGLTEVAVSFRGRAAHASASPDEGLNALDAVVAAYQGIAALRQHLRPGERIHGIITDGGHSPNIVPEHAAARFYLRSPSEPGLTALIGRAQAVFDGAALLTGTVATAEWDDAPSLPLRSNDPLATRFMTHLSGRERGAASFGAALDTGAGSTDMGNVSIRIPSIHPMVSIGPTGTALHTAEFAELAVSRTADDTIADAAIALAQTAADYLLNHEFQQAVAAAFDAAETVARS
ncbi:M20 family metallopeptidase [Agromyces mediolanus]|uniref:M20 family metallopeptidase n=1 Tax=Agromyces mediolanus TaxID=41986 RepID=UPI001E3E8E0B|nr:M20 family metallopeptidase [Agromyces mediolanus]